MPADGPRYSTQALALAAARRRPRPHPRVRGHAVLRGAVLCGVGTLLNHPPVGVTNSESGSSTTHCNPKDQYCSDEFADPVGAVPQSAKDVPVLQLGDGPLARSAECGVGGVGVLLPPRLAPTLERAQHHSRGQADIALVGQAKQSCALDPLGESPDAGGPGVVHRPWQCPGDSQQLPVRGGDHLHVHPVSAMLARRERSIGRQTVTGNQGAVHHHRGVASSSGPAQSLFQSGSLLGEQAGGLTHVPPRGGGRDAKARGQLGGGVRLCAGGPGRVEPGQRVPGGATATDWRCGGCGWCGRPGSGCGVTTADRYGPPAREALGGTVGLGRQPIYQGLPAVQETRATGTRL